MMRFVLVGGGSGGHFYPLIAVAESLRAENSQDIQLYYMGPEPYNQKDLDTLNIRYTYCPAGKRRRYASIRNVIDILFTPFAVLCAFLKLLFLYPDAIFSKGGYTSVPVVVAARLLRIPVVIHESDSVPGRANLLAAGYAKYIGVAYEKAVQYFPAEKTARVGIPIRQEFFIPITDPHTTLAIDHSRPVILVTGGSLGAEHINNLILDSLDELLPQYTIIHQTGTPHIESVKKTAQALVTDQNLLSHYHPVATMTGQHFHAAQAAAAVIISRAGSTTLYEIAYQGKPAIVIPIPLAISHDQHKNAYAYAASGAATVIEQANSSAGMIVTEIERITKNPDVYSNMSQAAKSFFIPDAAQKIAGILLRIAYDHNN